MRCDRHQSERWGVGRTLRHGALPDDGVPADRVAGLRRLCAGWVRQALTPALQVVVVRDGVVLVHGAWGRLGPEPDAPALGVDAIFPLASLTKPITATAVMCLVDDGLLDLNQPVQAYLPEFAGEGKAAVMVHHLLTHTSGLRDAELGAHATDRLRAGLLAQGEPSALDAFPFFRHVDALHNAPLWKPPGVEMSYCNYGYCLLGEIVRRVARRPPEGFVQDRILGPLGMTSTSYAGVPEERRTRVVRRSSQAPYAALLTCPDLWSSAAAPAAAAHSTALDLAKLGQMFLNGGVYGGARVLSQAAVREMTRNRIPGIPARYRDEFFPEAPWGLGWSIQGNKQAAHDGPLFSPTTFAHGGAGGSFLWVDPARAVVGACLSVLSGGIGDRSDRNLVDLFGRAVTAAITAE